MNCRQTQELISAYLDQEMTGQQMLEMCAHLRVCPDCARECRETGEMRRLLRALLPPSLPTEAERRLAERLTRPEVSAWETLASSLAAPRPETAPRGRRLATALGLSCAVILAVAAPFAPPTGDAAAVSAGNMATLPPLQMSQMTVPAAWSAGMLPDLFHVALFTRPARDRRTQDAPPDIVPGEAEPLRDLTVVDYEQGNAALADYRASATGAR